MNESRSEFANRQAALLSRRGMASDEVERVLSETVGRGADGDSALIRFPLVEKLVSQAGLTAGDAEKLHSGIAYRALRRSGAFTQTIRAVATIQAYALGIGMTATVIWFIWFHFVLPQFAEIYSAFGADLPKLTQMVMDPMVVGLILLVIWLPVLAIGLGGLSLRRVLRQLSNPPAILKAVPVVGRLLRVFTDWIMVSAGCELHDLTHNADRVKDALGAWRGQLGRDPATTTDGRRVDLDEALGLAGQLGTLDEELNYQAERLELEFPIQAARLREWLMICLMIVFGSCIGIMVIAMYLPIFGLAGVM
jgi:type IV pilus assembly protein PilC